LLRWLDSSGVRLVHLDGIWSSPRFGSRGLESGLSLSLDGLDGLDASEQKGDVL
jgi:hypothetical protein